MRSFPWWGLFQGSSGPAPHCCSRVSAVWGGGSWRPLGSFAALTEPCELSPRFKTSWVLFRLCVHLKVQVRVWLLLVSPQPSCGLTFSSPPSTQTPPTPAPAHPRPPAAPAHRLGAGLPEALRLHDLSSSDFEGGRPLGAAEVYGAPALVNRQAGSFLPVAVFIFQWRKVVIKKKKINKERKCHNENRGVMTAGGLWLLYWGGGSAA